MTNNVLKEEVLHINLVTMAMKTSICCFSLVYKPVWTSKHLKETQNSSGNLCAPLHEGLNTKLEETRDELEFSRSDLSLDLSESGYSACRNIERVLP